MQMDEAQNSAEQERVVQLLTEIRDLQKAHFKRYRQFTRQIEERAGRTEADSQQRTAELRAAELRRRRTLNVAFAIGIAAALFACGMQVVMGLYFAWSSIIGKAPGQ
jgi:ferric-dicitrate binding protein FerR (iron transport regulator)